MARFALASVVATLVLSACLGISAPEEPEIQAPLLLSPQATIPIRQNDPTIGCAFHPTHGYGFQVSFAWSPVQGAVRYRLLLQHAGSPIPALDLVVEGPEHLYRACNAYVIQANRFNWHWSVKAIAANGVEGAWATLGVYEFEAMTLPPRP